MFVDVCEAVVLTLIYLSFEVFRFVLILEIDRIALLTNLILGVEH